MRFEDLKLIPEILKALKDEGYTEPTSIQEKAIPLVLNRQDVLGSAQTGTGKTAAFAIPIIQHLAKRQKPDGKRKVTTLVVTPTRELALQIAESFTAYGRYTQIKNTVIYGGVGQGAQTDALRRGVDVLVATPGRLLDLMDQGYITLHHVRYFVLDEADRMLDMGFIHDIKKIITKLPEKRQSLFFSATMPQAISELSDQILNHPKRITIAPEQTTAEKVSQSVYFVSKADKNDLLKHVVTENPGASILVFSRTKHGADKIVKALHKSNIKSEAIHGNKSQNARQKTLQRFKKNKVSVLVATDIAARGIDVSKLSLVINYDLPNVPETYVHRIGRTGRAQEIGEAVSFCSNTEKRYLGDIQKLINQKIPVISDHPFYNPKDGGEFDAKKDKKIKNRSRSSSSTPKGSKKNGRSLKTKFKKNSRRKSNFKKSLKRQKG